MPAPAPIATIRRRCSSESLCRSEARLPKTAPNCLGAPSRPSGTPMPTMTIDSTALPSVRSAGRRPAWNQIAAVISMPLPLVSRVSSHWPKPMRSPAPSSNATWRDGLACRAASNSADGSAAPQASFCTALNKSVRAAAPRPAHKPVRTTASQKRSAPGSRSVAGTFASIGAGATGSGAKDFGAKIWPLGFRHTGYLRLGQSPVRRSFAVKPGKGRPNFQSRSSRRAT